MKPNTTYANAISPNERLDGFVGIRPDGKRMYFYNTHGKPEPLVFAVFAREAPQRWNDGLKQYERDESKPCGPWRRVALIADRSYQLEAVFIDEGTKCGLPLGHWSTPIHTLTPREKAEQSAIWWRVVTRSQEAQVIELRPVNSGLPKRTGSGVNPR